MPRTRWNCRTVLPACKFPFLSSFLFLLSFNFLLLFPFLLSFLFLLSFRAQRGICSYFLLQQITSSSRNCTQARGTIRPVASVKENPNLKDRLVSAAPVEDDSSFELKLRPKRLAEFIGQPKVKENLSVAIEAARSRGEALDHVLLYGPPGLGKTTLATIIAHELGVAYQ